MNGKTIFIFDAYGTLFDIDAACRNASEKLGESWITLSTVWRQKQLEYSWLRNSMDSYISFWEITQNALDFALKSMRIGDSTLRKELLNSYFQIESYPEVRDFLRELKKDGIKTCILSNGSKDMLTAAVANSSLEDLFDQVLSVDLCKKFKPAKEAYQLVLDCFGADRDAYLFFSSNCWDIHGASNFGMKTVWVNRFNKVDDYLPGSPDLTVKSLRGFEETTG